MRAGAAGEIFPVIFSGQPQPGPAVGRLQTRDDGIWSFGWPSFERLVPY